MSNSTQWAVSAGNKFRQAARESTNPTTKLLAEGLTHLTESLRSLEDELEALRKRG